MSACASLLPSWLRGLVVFTLMMLPARALAEPYPTSRPHPHGAATQIEFALALLDILASCNKKK
jgi:hypothetical protein